MEPLEIVFGGVALPASAVLDVQEGTLLGPDIAEQIAAEGGALVAAADPLDDELDSLLANADLSTAARREICARLGQGQFRAALLQLHGGCVVTGLTTPSVLRAAHIHRWADCHEVPHARRDPENGLLLSANIDALFEVGLIAFDDDGAMLISPGLKEDERAALGLDASMQLRHSPSSGQQAYLAKHRARTAPMRGGQYASNSA